MERRNRKLIFLLIPAFIILAGFSFGEVKLKTDKPLIDLSMTVTFSENEGEETDSAIPEDEGEVTVENEEIIVPAREFVIVVSDEHITLDGINQSGSGPVITSLGIKWKSGDEIKLVDDYAEYRAYKGIKDALDENGYKYTEVREK